MIRTRATRCTVLLFLSMSVLAGCGKDPRQRVLGKWKVVPQSARGGGGVESAGELGLRVTIEDDGTFVLTGNQMFEGLAGTKDVSGTYDFKADDLIHVEMKSRAFDYQPTDYSITEISKSELVLNTEDHSVTLLRDD